MAGGKRVVMWCTNRFWTQGVMLPFQIDEDEIWCNGLWSLWGPWWSFASQLTSTTINYCYWALGPEKMRRQHFLFVDPWALLIYTCLNPTQCALYILDHCMTPLITAIGLIIDVIPGLFFNFMDIMTFSCEIMTFMDIFWELAPIELIGDITLIWRLAQHHI